MGDAIDFGLRYFMLLSAERKRKERKSSEKRHALRKQMGCLPA